MRYDVAQRGEETLRREVSFTGSYSGVVVLVLAVDTVLRGTRGGRKFCIRTHLCLTSVWRRPKTTTANRKRIISSGRESIVSDVARGYSKLPVVIIGPTGSGKSTMLHDIRHLFRTTSKKSFFHRSCPSAYLSFRAVNYHEVDRLKPAEAESSQHYEIRSIASSVLRSIGYPQQCLLLRCFFALKSLIKPDANPEEKKNEEALDRLLDGISLLYDHLHEKNGLLVVDEIQDLVQDDSLRRQGGDRVFNAVIGHTAHHVANSTSSMKAVFAGSSNFLPTFLRKGSLASRHRRKYISHFDKEEVTKFLVDEYRIPEKLALKFIKNCGTRISVCDGMISDISGILVKMQNKTLKKTISTDGDGSDLCSILESTLDSRIQEEHDEAHADLKQFYSAVQWQDLKRVHRLLSRITNGETPVFLDELPTYMRQNNEILSKAMYVGYNSQLHFQNRAVEIMWKRCYEPLTTDGE